MPGSRRELALRKGSFEVFHEGTLHKRGQTNSSYRRRWFILSGNEMFYFQGSEDGARGSIKLTFVSQCRRLPRQSDGLFPFEVNSAGQDGRVFQLASDNERVRDTWIERIHSAILLDTTKVVSSILIPYLESDGIQCEGVFRIPGDVNVIERIRGALIAPRRLSQPIPTDADSASVASFLKQMLRDLPEPVLTFRLYKEFITADGLPKIHELFDRLPSANKKLLVNLLPFLAKVASYENVNKMSAKNLGIVFGPVLARPEPGSLEPEAELHDIPAVNRTAEMLIQTADTLAQLMQDRVSISSALRGVGNSRPQSVALSSAPTIREALAQFGFQSSGTDKISFVEGERLYVSREYENGWCYGQNERGERGYFPTNYITFVQAAQHARPAKGSAAAAPQDITAGLLPSAESAPTPQEPRASLASELQSKVAVSAALAAKVSDADRSVVGEHQPRKTLSATMAPIPTGDKRRVSVPRIDMISGAAKYEDGSKQSDYERILEESRSLEVRLSAMRRYADALEKSLRQSRDLRTGTTTRLHAVQTALQGGRADTALSELAAALGALNDAEKADRHSAVEALRPE